MHNLMVIPAFIGKEVFDNSDLEKGREDNIKKRTFQCKKKYLVLSSIQKTLQVIIQCLFDSSSRSAQRSKSNIYAIVTAEMRKLIVGLRNLHLMMMFTYQVPNIFDQLWKLMDAFSLFIMFYLITAGLPLSPRLSLV